MQNKYARLIRNDFIFEGGAGKKILRAISVADAREMRFFKPETFVGRHGRVSVKNFPSKQTKNKHRFPHPKVEVHYLHEYNQKSRF